MRSVHVLALVATTMLLQFPSLAWSNTVETQNIFEAGEKARAAEVNDNFTAVKDAVDGNDALITGHETRIEDLESLEGVPGPQGETGPHGETGEAGPSGAPGLSLRVVDGSGGDIGLLLGWTVEQEGVATVYNELLGVVIAVERRDGVPTLNNRVLFADLGCVGQPYVLPWDTDVLMVVDDDQRSFVSVDGAESERLVITATLRSGVTGCHGESGSTQVLPAREVTSEMPFTFPLPLPIRIHPEP
jgi:hypothetical protein